MSIRFKFRSSVAFDTIDLGGRRSISVRDLRSEIIARKKLRLCEDFDLVITDAETGSAFEDEELQIKEGSSVVVKRVPGRSVPWHSDFGNVDRTMPTPLAPPMNVVRENFDDFGMDFYPNLQGPLPGSDADLGTLKFTSKESNAVPRSSETSALKCKKVEGSDLSEAMSKEVVGDNCCKEFDTEEIQKQSQLEPKKEAHKQLDKDIGMPFPPVLNLDVPNELRCSLCTAIFKDAVMIPCCQHSFCEKCIQSALIERGMCPKCSSTKCKVGALLPNLSLRQAIEHFLEAQAAADALEKKVLQDAPDVESGIHGKDFSYAIPVRQREPSCLYSPSATGKGSNQTMVESAFKNRLTGGTDQSVPLPLKNKQMKGQENSSAEALGHMANFQGLRSSSKLPQYFMQEEGNEAIPKNAPDVSGSYVHSNWQRKGGRNCYVCGSPNHLMRDCPAASSTYPFSQTGDAAFSGSMSMYGQAYWQGPTFPQSRPYVNMYGGGQGMVPFDPSMAPVSSFSFSPYMSSIYGGMPGSYGFMRMGGVRPPFVSGAERPFARQMFGEPQDGEQMHKSLNKHREGAKDHDFEDLPEDQYNLGSKRTDIKRRHQLDEETSSDDDSPSCQKKPSKDKFCGSSHQQPPVHLDEEPYPIERRHERSSHQSHTGRDQKSRSDKSKLEHLSDTSNRHSREKKHLHHHENFFEKPNENRSQHAHELSRRSKYDEKIDKDHRRSSHVHHHHPTETSLEHSYSGDRRHHHKEKESSDNKMPKSKGDKSEYERWAMDGTYRGESYRKRRRMH